MERKEIESHIKRKIKDPEYQRRALAQLDSIYSYFELDERKTAREKELKEKTKKTKEVL